MIQTEMLVSILDNSILGASTDETTQPTKQQHSVVVPWPLLFICLSFLLLLLILWYFESFVEMLENARKQIMGCRAGGGGGGMVV